MKNQRSTEIKVGITVLIGLILFIYVLSWTKNFSFTSSDQIIKVMFDNVSGLETGNNVTVNGVKEGFVKDITVYKASAIVTFTYQGRTARNLSKFRPEAKIIALSNNFETMNTLCLRWGVTSIYMEDIDKERIAVDKAKKLILENGQVKEGDTVIFTAGAPYSDKSRVNWLRFEVI